PNPIAAIIRHAMSMPELTEQRNALRFSALRLLIIRQTLSPRIVYMQGRARQSWRFPVRWASLEIADAPSRPSETSRRLSRTPDRGPQIRNGDVVCIQGKRASSIPSRVSRGDVSTTQPLRNWRLHL